MNILFVAPRLPFPPDTGAKIRTFNLIQTLSRHSRITLLSFYEHEEELIHLPPLKAICEKVLVVPNHSYKKGHLFKGLVVSLVSEKPYVIRKYFGKQMAHTIKNCLTDNSYNLIHFDHLHMGQYVGLTNGLPCVVDEHNVEHRIWERYHGREDNPFKKLYIGQQAHKMKYFEGMICEKASLCTAVSEEDREELMKIAPKANLAVIPNGVDIDYFQPMKCEPRPYTLVFVGSMDWLPNDDAMIYFCKEIFPLILNDVPQTKLYIVGRNPSENLKANQSDRIVVTGAVEDVRPYYRDAALVVVPIRIGGGTRLKILEAMAMKKAVVSTSIGCEGLEVVPGENILVEETSEEFAKKTVMLLTDEHKRETLGKQGRKLVEERYDWKIIGRRLYHAYQQLMAGRKDDAQA